MLFSKLGTLLMLFFNGNGISCKLPNYDEDWILHSDSYALLNRSNPYCGKSNSNVAKRIIGGTFANENEFPWMAVLYYTESRKKVIFAACGGSIISKQFILTAAHCVNDQALHHMSAGNNTISSSYAGEGIPFDKYVREKSDIFAKNIIIHPEYNSNHSFNDAAVVIAEDFIEFRDNIGPICLPLHKPYLTGSNFIIAGFGITRKSDSQSSTRLMKTKINMMPHKQCESFLQNMHGYFDKSLCSLSLFTNNKGICSGDSGGPLMKLEEDQRFHLYGIISSTDEKCEVFNTFSNVHHLLPFIFDVIKRYYKD